MSYVVHLVMGSVTAERRAPALRDHEKLGRAELELCAPSAVTDPLPSPATRHSTPVPSGVWLMDDPSRPPFACAAVRSWIDRMPEGNDPTRNHKPREDPIIHSPA